MYRVSTVCLSRLLLNLRDGALGSQMDSEKAGQEGGSTMSTLDFSRFVGPLGNSVDDGISHAEEDADAAEDSVDHDDNPALDSASFLAPSDNHPDEIS